MIVRRLNGARALAAGTLAPPLVGMTSMYCAIEGLAGGRSPAVALDAAASTVENTAHAMTTPFVMEARVRYQATMVAQQETASARAATATRALAVPWWLVGTAAAGVTFWLAYENGSYAQPTRDAITIAVWWGVIVAVVSGLVAKSRALVASAAVGSALALFGLWTLASTAWTADSARAFSEFDRVSLYLGVFVLCSLLFRRRDLAAWCDGIGFGIVAVASLALVSRFFPGAISRESGATILPALTSASATRWATGTGSESSARSASRSAWRRRQAPGRASCVRRPQAPFRCSAP